MLTSEQKRNVASGAVFGLPIALVLVAANFMGPGPSASTASDGGLAVAAGTGAVATATSTSNPMAGAALDHIASLDGESFGASPLYNPERGEELPINEDPGLPDVPTFQIRLIMATSSGNIALIDNERYRVGQELADTGWLIVDIDAKQRSVTIEDQIHGRIRTQRVDGPSMGGRVEVRRGGTAESSPSPAPQEGEGGGRSAEDEANEAESDTDLYEEGDARDDESDGGTRRR